MAYSPNSTQTWQGLSFDKMFYDECNPTAYMAYIYQPQYVWPSYPNGLVVPISLGDQHNNLVAKRCEILGYMDSIITQAEAKSWKPREYRVSNPYYECVVGLTTHYRTFPIIYDASVPFEVIRLIWD